MANLIDGGSTLVEHNIELMRQCMESGNIRIRKLNEFRNLRRLTRPIEDNVSSDEEEESIPTISSFLTNINSSLLQLAPAVAHTSTIH